MADSPTTMALDVVPSSTGDALPVPAFGGAQMAQAFVAYRDLQAALDQAMPDQIMPIGEKRFRKKGYWRAVAVAFDLTVEPVAEQREERGTFNDGAANFGYLVTYRATTARGRSMHGDGACFAIEKAERFRCPHPHPSWQGKSEHYPHETCPDYDPDFKWFALPAQASEHNVRSHAHTRAFNRAVSNLVGFGEVSAEEVDRDDDDARGSAANTGTPRRASGRISEPQVRRLWVIARRVGWTDDEVRTHLRRYGFEHTNEITRDKYDAIVKELETGTTGGAS